MFVFILQYFSMIAFTEIVGCNGTVIYSVIAKQMEFFTSGRLQLQIAYDGMLLLRLNEFEYSINGSEKMMYDNHDPQYSLVLYLTKYPTDQWIVKMNENTDAVFSCLSQKCYLKNKHENYKKQQQRKDHQRKEQPKKVVKENQAVILTEEEEESENKNGGLIVGASKQLNKGLKFTGGLLSKGFESLGGFIAKKVPKKEEKEIKETTKQNIKLAKNTTKNVFEFASAQVGNLFRFGKSVASDIGDRFQKSDKGKELQENPRYESIKQGAKTGVGVIANVYDGVVGAVYSVGSGVAKGVGKVIGARYGEQAGQAADEVFQGAGNAMKIMRVPADQIANTLK